MTKPPRPRQARPLPVLVADRDAALLTFLQLFRTFARIERRLEGVTGPHGVTLSQFDVLATLGRDEGITQQDLAQRLLVTKGNVCGLLDRMQSSGWVERRPDAADRRANRLFLTAGGRTVLKETFPSHVGAVQEIMGVLKSEELQRLLQYLDRIEAGMDE
jgi:DNA-binding MarR family transcriptional regulator